MSTKVRFGVYELDIDGRELRKNGVRLRLQEQPFRILAALSGKPGELVSREELRDCIWTNDTFVDFDQSLNKAINRLREVLNDNASQPRYIETVTRRGYRFVAHVTKLDPGTQEPDPRPPVEGTADTSGRRGHILVAALTGAAVVISVAVVAAICSLNTPTQAMPSAPRLLTQDSFFPSLSRDGKLLVYLSTVGGDVPHIWVRQTAGGKAIQVTRGLDGDFGPDLSPDGTQILYCSERQGGGAYMVPTFPGETKLMLAGADWPKFSPDGQTILCLGPNGRVLTLAVNQAQPVSVEAINRGYQVDSPPLWSPTGKEILLLGRRKGEPATSDQWWIAGLPRLDPRRLVIPELERVNGNQPWVQNWTRQRDGRSFVTYSVQEQDT